jgi:hypothetical protein
MGLQKNSYTCTHKCPQSDLLCRNQVTASKLTTTKEQQSSCCTVPSSYKGNSGTAPCTCNLGIVWSLNIILSNIQLQFLSHAVTDSKRQYWYLFWQKGRIFCLEYQKSPYFFHIQPNVCTPYPSPTFKTYPIVMGFRYVTTMKLHFTQILSTDKYCMTRQIVCGSKKSAP